MSKKRNISKLEALRIAELIKDIGELEHVLQALKKSYIALDDLERLEQYKQATVTAVAIVTNEPPNMIERLLRGYDERTTTRP